LKTPSFSFSYFPLVNVGFLRNPSWPFSPSRRGTCERSFLVFFSPLFRFHNYLAAPRGPPEPPPFGFFFPPHNGFVVGARTVKYLFLELVACPLSSPLAPLFFSFFLMVQTPLFFPVMTLQKVMGTFMDVFGVFFWWGWSPTLVSFRLPKNSPSTTPNLPCLGLSR